MRDEVRTHRPHAAGEGGCAADAGLRSLSFKSRMRSAGAMPWAAPFLPVFSTFVSGSLVIVLCTC